MNNVTKESLRWFAVVCCGGYGLVYLPASLCFMLSRPDEDWFFVVAFGLPSALLVYVPLLLVSYFCWRRRYRHLLLMLSGVLAIWVFLVLAGLPTRSGFDHWLFSPEIATKHWWPAPFAITFGLATLVAPFFVARWVFRLGQRTTGRFFPASSTLTRSI